MEIPIPAIFISAFVIMVGVTISLAFRQAKRARENLQRLADELGLQANLPPERRYLPVGPGTVEGDYRGRSVRIYSFSTGSGKSRTQWCAVDAQARNPDELTFSISAENIFTRAGRALGMQEVAVGDDAFDRKFFVRSNQPDYIRMALIPEVRARFLSKWQGGSRGSIKVKGGTVTYSEVGTLANAKIIARMPQMVDLVCDAADIVETYQA